MNDPIHLVSLFWTFQGEGKFAGHRALFVRMPFCNLACSWCDTEFDTFKKYSESEIECYALSEKARFAVITGGEPMLHKHTKRVVDLLHKLGFYVAVESNGTQAPNAPFDFVTLSPKRDTILKFPIAYYIHPDALKVCDELKYVVDKDFDFRALDRHNDLDLGKRLSLSPEFTELHENLKKIFSYIWEYPHWVISLQTHKFMRIP